MKVFGNSMLPLIPSGSLLTYKSEETYEVGDVVYCSCKGRRIDAHLITKKASDGRYMIANKRGYENGWTRRIFGRVVKLDGEPFGRK